MSEETISGDEIDRVFDDGFTNGSLNERERIIALSQEQTAHDENGDLMLAEYWETIVALIKGENK